MERAAPAHHHAATPQRPDENVDLQCPRCGRWKARVIGRSDAWSVLYLRCEACQQTSVAGTRV